MVYTNTWNSAFEALPPDTGEAHSLGANRIRALKNAIRERLSKDHYLDIAGTDADHGEHSQVTFHANVATPANVVNKSTLYAQVANAKLELWYKNDANQAVQITSNGAVSANVEIPSGTKMLIYADTAPSGWTIQNTLDDKLVFVTKGSAAGGQTGGSTHSTGTWTQPSHNHAGPTHYHGIPLGYNATYPHFDANQISGNFTASHLIYAGMPASATLCSKFISDANSVANTGGAATVNTWRPAAYTFIICSKN